MVFRANLQGSAEFADALEEVAKMSAAFTAERNHLSQNLAQDLIDPCFRRTLIRLECARLEGMTACMKRVALAGANYSGVTYSEADLKILRDEKFVSTKKNAEICWRAFRQALRPKDDAMETTINWDAYMRSQQIRNRVVHPKYASDLDVSESETVEFIEGITWFIAKVTELAETAKIDFTTLTRRKKIYRREQPKLGRNEICPCGCGRKVKNCLHKPTT